MLIYSEASPEIGPYIGITGFTKHSQIAQVLRSAPISSPYYLMAGVLVSDKSLAGIPNKYPHRYPSPELAQQIFHQDCFNAVHYHSGDPDADLVQVAKRCRLQPGQGMQLNILWPNPQKVKQLQEQGIITILQLGPQALQLSDQQILEKLLQYPSLSYVLVDGSGGTGTPLEQGRCVNLLRLLRRELPLSLPVLAGGLGPGCSRLLRGLMRELAGDHGFPLSVDAESRVRDQQDRLSLERCHAYLNEAVAALRGFND